jgi:hypothetical protein
MHRGQRGNRFSENPAREKGFDYLFILDNLIATTSEDVNASREIAREVLNLV